MSTDFSVWPLGDDYLVPWQPDANVEDRGIEFSFAIPIPIAHPQTGQPLFYTGRFDMLAVDRRGVIWAEDDKTASQLGAQWGKQWTLDLQFTGYVWAARQYDVPVYGAAVRGISILKTMYGHAEQMVARPPFLVDRWYQEMLGDVQRMIDIWTEGTNRQAIFRPARYALDRAFAEHMVGALMKSCATPPHPNNGFQLTSRTGTGTHFVALQPLGRDSALIAKEHHNGNGKDSRAVQHQHHRRQRRDTGAGAAARSRPERSGKGHAGRPARCRPGRGSSGANSPGPSRQGRRGRQEREAGPVAAESHTPKPQVEYRIPEVGAIEHNVGYVDDQGNAVPVASQYDTIHQKSINAPDYPAASGLAAQGAPLTIGGNVYTAVKVPNGGGVEYYPQGKEEEQLFHNIPGVPAGYVALTPAGEKALKAEGLLDGEKTGDANGIPVYKLKTKSDTDSTPTPSTDTGTDTQTPPPPETPKYDHSVKPQPDNSLPDQGFVPSPTPTEPQPEETTLPDGTKETAYSDGSKKQVKSDGSTVYVSADGTVSDTAPAGSKAAEATGG